MSTIKEIARKTNLSPGTISLVLNGRGDALRISKKTQQRILDAAEELGYLPNVSARRLRQFGGKNLPIIAVFWPPDLSADVIGRFIMGAQSSILEQGYAYEMSIQPYKRTNVQKIKELCDSGMFNGAILTGISTEEQQILEEDPLSIPTVMFNRHSRIYSCVHVDSYEIGRKTAALFASRGHKEVGSLVPAHLVTSAYYSRQRGFEDACLQYGLELERRHVQVAPMTMEGGNAAARNIVKSGGALPTAIFFPLGIMAAAALPVFHQAGIKIPDDLEIMTYGDSEVEKYSVPSLSAVKFPVEDMAAGCIRLVMGAILGTGDKVKSIEFNTPFMLRESCGGITDSL